MDWTEWERCFVRFLEQQTGGDAAHGLGHIRRVVANARRLAAAENAELMVVIPAAWLHDCVVVPKDSPDRPRASRLAAEAAVGFLAANNYPAKYLAAIHHAIEAHSFTANIPARTAEARVVQDADRLDAIGAIGIARCLMLGGAMGQPLYDEREPFPVERPPDDTLNILDHFYVKLLHLAKMMQTPSGRKEAEQRTAFMQQYLQQLGNELALESA